MKGTSKEYLRLLFTLDAVSDLSQQAVEALGKEGGPWARRRSATSS